jgi:hypothetical protein
MRMKNWSYALFAAILLSGVSTMALAQVNVDVSVNIAPPELPQYDQPPIPGDGYVWTPGYWAWGDDIQDYYWVPGTWVEAPQQDYLWTPGYWAADGAAFFWHPGYWGPQVGFYGGVNYGYGYGGNGYQGGYWRNGRLYYNRAVVNVGSARITNVYNRTVVNNVTVNRISYNGGNGGIRARPSAEQEAAGRDRHIEYTNTQRDHQQAASRNQDLRLSQNHGNPAIAATPRPGAFTGSGVVAAGHGAPTSNRINQAPARDVNQGQDDQNRMDRRRPAAPQQQQQQQQQQQRSEPRAQPNQPRPETRPEPPRENTAPRPQVVEPPRTAPRPPEQHAQPAPQQQQRAAPEQHDHGQPQRPTPPNQHPPEHRDMS